MDNKVAIITRTKNRPILLERAIQSVCAQSLQDWVLIIVNDGGSQKEVDNLVARYQSSLQGRAKVIHNEESLGMEAASNIGIKNSDSEYILIHDDDDTLAPTFLEKTVGFLESSFGQKFKGVSSKVIRVIEQLDNNSINIISKESHNRMKKIKNISLAKMLEENILTTISFLYKREVHDKIGYYNENLPVMGDWEFNLRFLCHFDIHLIHEELAYCHHRLSKKGSESNTVIGGIKTHWSYEALIRNEWLRRDLAEGKLGLGVLMNFNRPNTDQTQKQNYSIDANQIILKQLQYNKIKNCIIYGAGEFGQTLSEELKSNGIKIDYFVDTNREIHGEKIKDIKVLSISEAVHKGYKNFVIGSLVFTEGIARTIQHSFENTESKPFIIAGG